MTTSSLSHVIYASSACTSIDDTNLSEILKAARAKNARLNISGMLLYTEGCFFQVLEGEDSVLKELLRTIIADPRHKNITKIIEECISERDFGDWTMGFSEINFSDLRLVDGLSDFFQQGEFFIGLPPGRAKKLLAAFADGRWRLQGCRRRG